MNTDRLAALISSRGDLRDIAEAVLLLQSQVDRIKNDLGNLILLTTDVIAAAGDYTGDAGQEYAPVIAGFTGHVTVEQTADGVEVYRFDFQWDAPTDDKLVGVHVWAHETERDTWTELSGPIPATDNSIHYSSQRPLEESCTFDLWAYSVSSSGRENNRNDAVTPHVHLAQIKPSVAGQLKGDRIKDSTLQTAAFASSIRPVTLVNGTLPTLPDPLYPAGSILYDVSIHSLFKVNSTGTAWEKAIHGGLDIQAGSVTANEILANTITAGQIAAGAIGTSELYAGEILVGAGGGKPTRFRVNDGSGNMIGFIGDNGAGFIGAYLINLRVGSDINNPIVLANSGGITISGAKVVVATPNYGTVTLDPAATYHPVLVADVVNGHEAGVGANNTVGAEMTCWGAVANRYPLVWMRRNASNARMEVWGHASTGGRVLCYADSTSGYINIIGGSYKIDSVDVINSSKQFVGAGVLCTTYGVAAAGFNPYVGGVQYTGDTQSPTVVVSVSTSYFYLRVNSGVLEYSTDNINFSALGMTAIGMNTGFSAGSSVLNFKGGALTSIT